METPSTSEIRPAVLDEHAGHGGVEEVGQGAGEDGADAEAGDAAAALGGDLGQAAEEDGEGAEVGEDAEGEGDHGDGLVGQLLDLGAEVGEGDDSLRISFSPRNEPAVTASDQGTPMTKATGAKT